jgi:hypothetical protein
MTSLTASRAVAALGICGLLAAGCGGGAGPTGTAPPAATSEVKLKDLMAVEVTTCRYDLMRGTIVNNSDVTADIAIVVHWLNDGTVMDDATDTILGLRVGEEARWSFDRPATGRSTDCRVEVRSAREP